MKCRKEEHRNLLLAARHWHRPEWWIGVLIDTDSSMVWDASGSESDFRAKQIGYGRKNFKRMDHRCACGEIIHAVSRRCVRCAAAYRVRNGINGKQVRAGIRPEAQAHP